MIERVRAWLLERNPEISEIGLDEDIIDSRLIDSMEFPELLIFLEEIAGRELELTRESAVAFRTLRGIRDKVLSSVASHD